MPNSTLAIDIIRESSKLMKFYFFFFFLFSEFYLSSTLISTCCLFKMSRDIIPITDKLAESWASKWNVPSTHHKIILRRADSRPLRWLQQKTENQTNREKERKKKSFQMENQTIDSSWRLSSVVAQFEKFFSKFLVVIVALTWIFPFIYPKLYWEYRSEMKYLHIKSTLLSLISRLRFWSVRNWKKWKK